MKRYTVIEKKVGETPLAALSAWKDTHPEYKEVSASYAGRLDPMASGKLLVLFGEECKRQGEYTSLDKEYEIEVLLDVGSDTGDALGIVTSSQKETRTDPAIIKQILTKEEGKHERPYPVFSSKTVNGKPLFLYALEGTLNTITIPVHEEQIYRTTYLETEKISASQLRSRIGRFLSLVPRTEEPSKALGENFRIDTVRSSWDRVFKNDTRFYLVIRLRVVCASGTYMRALAGRIGEALGTSALALSIHRTKIGKYWNGIWFRQY